MAASSSSSPSFNVWKRRVDDLAEEDSSLDENEFPILSGHMRVTSPSRGKAAAATGGARRRQRRPRNRANRPTCSIPVHWAAFAASEFPTRKEAVFQANTAATSTNKSIMVVASGGNICTLACGFAVTRPTGGKAVVDEAVCDMKVKITKSVVDKVEAWVLNTAGSKLEHSDTCMGVAKPSVKELQANSVFRCVSCTSPHMFTPGSVVIALA